MKQSTLRQLGFCVLMVAIFCALLRGWDAVTSFVGLVLTAIVPLVLGAAIAYVISIPTNFLERHFFPQSTSRLVVAMRRPVGLVVTVVVALVTMVLSSAVLFPALVETVTMVQKNGQAFVLSVIQQPIMEPVRDTLHDLVTGDFVEELKNMDIPTAVRNLLSGAAGSLTTQVFTVVSTIMTGFFGMMFSFILLTDTTNVGHRVMRIVSEYLGERRTERLALVFGVADASFHNFIVRQCIEALILGSVGTGVLLVAGFRYSLGVGVLMFFAALVPIVGYPIGLFAGAFMVAINNVWLALIYLVAVAVTQVLESTFVLPHVGDPHTALPPVWVTVAVTIGGGVAGFLGMLVAIPLASTIRQLILIDVRRREKGMYKG